MKIKSESLNYLKKTVNEDASKKVELSGYLAEFRTALEQEIKEIEKSGESVIIVKNGKRLGYKGGSFFYTFQAEYMYSMPTDTPCQLKLGEGSYEVVVASVEENSIILSSVNQLPDILGKGELQTGSSILMKLLIKRIESNKDNENSLAKRLMASVDWNDMEMSVPPYNGNTIHNIDDIIIPSERNENQREAVRSAIQKDMTFIWGPPGTGKSSVIADIITELYRESRTVLMVSHTNIAVDGAIKKSCESIQPVLKNEKGNSDDSNADNQVFPILRYGNAAGLPDEVSLDAHVSQLGKNIEDEKKRLNANRLNLQDQESDLNKCLNQYNWKQQTQIERIEAGLRKADEKETSLKEDRLLNQKLTEKIQALDNNHPEWGSLHRQLESLIQDRIRINKEISDFNLKNKGLRAKLEIDIEERKDIEEKRREYYEILDKIDSQPTVSEQKNRITRSRERIEEGQNIRIKIITEYNQNRSIVDEYNRKSNFRKFFAGRSSKATFEKAERCLTDLEKQITEIDKKIEFEQDLLLRLEVQLQNIKQLKNQADHFENIKDSGKLDEAIALTSQEIDLYSGKIKQLEEDVIKLDSSIETIISKLESSELYCEYQQIKCDKKEVIKSMRLYEEDLKELQIHIKMMIDKEIELTKSFYVYKNKENLVSDLKILYNEFLYSEEDIEKIREQLPGIKENISLIEDRLEEIEKEEELLRYQALMDAQVVGTTLTKSYISDDLYDRVFDTVILDEASMAGIPALWCSCLLALSNIIIVGDFLQLSPIVRAGDKVEAKKWLGTDIFQLIGFPDMCKDARKRPNNFIILNKQYRMKSDIAEVANIYYEKYHTKLESDDELLTSYSEFISRYQPINNVEKQHSICMLDTEKVHAWCNGVATGRNSSSRLNLLSSVYTVELAFYLLEPMFSDDPNTDPKDTDPIVLIITPYRPQAERLKKLIELEFENRQIEERYHDRIKAGTVHSFQGSEAAIVIFDLVIDEPHFKNNLFIPNTEKYKEVNLSNERMFNVAITRARYKYYLIGNFNFIKKHAKGNALRTFLNKVERSDSCRLDITQVFPDILFDRDTSRMKIQNLHGKILSCKGVDYDNYFLEDIRKAERRIIIFSPFLTNNRVSKLLPIFVDAVHAGKSIIVITKDLNERDSARESYNSIERQLKSFGVVVIHKKGMHEKLVLIDDSVVWQGSLNVLSFTGNTGEIMNRIDDNDHFKNIFDLMEIKFYLDVISNKEIRCPICEKEMFAADLPDAGIYWKCQYDGFSMTRNDAYPHEGIYICKYCGKPYYFSMKNQPRWVCPDNSRHFRQVKLNDLRLPSMMKTLTETDYKSVKQYFEEHVKKRVISPITGNKVSVQQFFTDLSFQNQTIDEQVKSCETITNTASLKIDSDHKTEILEKTKRNEITPKKSSYYNSRPVVQYSLDGKKLRTFPSVKQAAKAVGVDSKGIRSVLAGKQKTSGGYVWREPGDDFNTVQLKIK